jgi:N-acetylglucosamine kinase-like BadF-type ATPase
MNNNLNQNLVVGLDAGGTRTRAVLADDASGAGWSEGVAGPGNALTVTPADLADHLAWAIGEAVPAGLRGRVVAVGAGFAGAARTPDDEPGRVAALAALATACRRLGITPAVVEVCSDLEACFASAPGTPAEGLALVAGTGFWIGRSAVRAALNTGHGRGRPTALTAAVGRALLPGRQLPEGPAEAWSARQREAYRARLLPAVMSEPPVRLARLAPLVADSARDGDPVAAAILDEAAELLAATVRTLRPRPGERLVGTGGLLGPDGPLTARLAPHLDALGLRTDWTEDGRCGAVALARIAYGRLPAC